MSCTAVAVRPALSEHQRDLLKVLSSLGVQLPSSADHSVSALRARCKESIQNASKSMDLSTIHKGPPPKSAVPRKRGEPLGTVPMTVEEERQQLLRIITSMVVHFPPSTKLPKDALRDRVAKAVGLSQTTAELFGINKIPNVEHMEPWSGEELLITGMSHYERGVETLAEWGALDCKIDPFNEVRTKISEGFAFAYELGMDDTFAVMETDGDRLIKLKVTGAYKAAQENHLVVPFMTVEYRVGTVADDDFEGTDELPLSPDAHTFFRILLETNAVCTEDGKPRLSEDGMIKSFLLPLNDLVHKDVGILTKDLGCAVCGNPITSRCSRCQLAGYCGTACQRSHWKEHKPSCVRLSDGTWISIKYTNCHRYNDRQALAMRIPRYWDGEPTIYGNQPFLVRVEALRFPDGKPYLVVSDRKETFTGLFQFRDDPMGYAQLMCVLQDLVVRNRIYFWAKYLGNLTLKLRIDPKPDQSMLVW
ncbi:hypothetical protein ACEPAG_3334 [Sanghuangporus baumii]